MNAGAKAKGEFGYGAQCAGQAAPLASALAAGDLMAQLERETRASIERLRSAWA